MINSYIFTLPDFFGKKSNGIVFSTGNGGSWRLLHISIYFYVERVHTFVKNPIFYSKYLKKKLLKNGLITM